MLVAVAAFVQPAQQGFDEQQEQEGGQGVALQGAPVNADWVGVPKAGADGGSGTAVQFLHHLHSVHGEAHVPH